MNFTIGKISFLDNGISYQLHPGRNVIGRKSLRSEADIQIDTAGKRSMSREHIVIEVKKVPIKGFVHYLTLYKEKVNPTYIREEQVLYGDCIILSHGDIIKLPDAILKFEIPDEEATDI
ncbi:MAG: FHA domain-containing protein [Bacteroides sp.]|nr:FHA domain-containing protein [Bacteroides sp.]